MSKEVLLEKLTDTTYRNAFISEEIDTGLPMQLRAMREARGWNQKYVAEKMETKQPRFSLMEKPGYGNFSLNTLKRLASIFNVGLIVSFVPYSEMIEFTNAFSRKRLEIPSFADEYSKLARRYGARTDEQDPQPSFDFTAGTAGGTYDETSAPPQTIIPIDDPLAGELQDIPLESYFAAGQEENIYA